MLVEGEVTTGMGSVAVGLEVEASAEAMMNYFDVVVSLKNWVLVWGGRAGLID